MAFSSATPLPSIFAYDSFLAHWRPRLPPALEALLIVLLAVQAARLIWIVLPASGAIGMPAPARGQDIAIAPSLSGYGDLFFRSSTVDSGKSDTTQGYMLFGMRIDGSNSSAILGKDGVQATHRVGDTIAPDLVLEAVENGHVSLRRGTALLRLEMPDKPVLAPPPKARRLPSGRPPAPRKLAGDPPDAARDVLASAGLRAHEDGGYVLSASSSSRSAENSLLQRAGLLPGDVVMAVDGRPLTAERLGQLRTQLQQRGQISVTVRRDGRTRTIDLKAPP